MAKNGNGKASESATETAQIAPDPMELRMGTLSGDVRDEILREFKTIPNIWAKLDEDGQQRLIDRAEHIALMIVDTAVDIVASRGIEFFKVTLGKIEIDKGITCKFTLPATEEAIGAIFKRRGDTVILVARDPHQFLGERERAKPDVVGTLAMPHGQEGGEQQPVERVDPETGEVTTTLTPAPQAQQEPAHA